jgi:D-sedoheptulose 7-phosphate isomerase
MKETIEERLSIIKELEKIDIDSVVSFLKEIIISGNTIFWCGNGGSASQADHLSAELLGRFKKNRSPYASHSLIPNSSLITCISNDFGYDNIFSRQLEGIAKSGDACALISTSGTSQNILNAYEICKKKGIKTLLFLGNVIDPIYEDSEIIISIPSNKTDIIQECHLIIGHIICDQLENIVP